MSKKIYRYCPYCDEKISLQTTGNFIKDEYQLQWKFSDHIKAHQDVGDAPIQRSEREI